MFTTVETAHVTHLKDQRQDALRVLEDAKRRLDREVGPNGILGEVTQDVRRLLQEAIERCRDWCPALFGAGALKVDETCQCFQCTWDDQDPFEGQDEPG